MNNKILLVHYSSAPGGIEVLMPGIINMLPEKEFLVFVIRPPLKGYINVYQSTPQKVIYGSENNFIAAFKLWRFARGNKKSVFHGFNLGPFFLLLLRIAGIRKVIYSIRGSIYWHTSIQKLMRKFFWKLSFSDSFKFVANSEFSKETFSLFTGYPLSNIEVIYNPVGLCRLVFNNTVQKKSGLRIIYVGRLTDGKNLYKWIDVAVLIKKKYPEAEFFIYGDGMLKGSLMNYSATTGIGNSIFFMGYNDQIVQAYLEADVLIFLSEFESFGNVVVESILCETPVIVSNIPSFQEIFSSYPEFLVSLDGNLEINILNKIGKLDFLKILALKAKSEFEVRFSMERHVNRLREIYGSFNQ